MLYSEFVSGTGCKDNAHNYKVYRDLEIMYMNSDMSKAEVYEYGKKLVDNSKSEQELKFEAELKERINSLKRGIEQEREFIAWKQQLLESFKESGDKEMVRFYRNTIKSCKSRIAELRREIAACKFILES